MQNAARTTEDTTADRMALAVVAVIYVVGVLLVVAAPSREQPTARAAGTPGDSTTGAAPVAGVQPSMQSADTPQSVSLARHAMTFELKPGAGFEFKYRLDKGASMVYSWASSGVVKFELHGEPDGARAGYADSYRMGEDRAGRGTFVAPTKGIHGWYWENPGQAAVTVALTTSGFYTAALELRASGPVEHKLDH